MDAVAMMRPPPPCATIWRAATWPQRNTPVRLTRSTRCHWASGCSRNGAEWAIPALANITSSRPNSATARSTNACTWPASPTSTSTVMAWPPVRAISFTTASAAAVCTSPSTTAAPSAAKSCAVARPMPSAPPVIAATRPFKRITGSPSCGDGMHASAVCRRRPRDVTGPRQVTIASPSRAWYAAEIFIDLVTLPKEIRMFFELRQYVVRPGKQAEWVKCMEEEIIPFQVKMGMVILGSFVGEEDASVYVWIRRFESEAERKRLYDAVYQSDYWKNEMSPRIPTMIDREQIKVTRIVATPRSVIQ